MKVSKAYIIRIETDVSKEYAEFSAKTCDDVGLPWEYFEGYTLPRERHLWRDFEKTAGVPIKRFRPMGAGAAGCTASHVHLWKQIADNKECVVVLEHDGIMLHPLELDIPEDKIVALGYKYYNWRLYNKEAAGPPKQIVDTAFNPGSHAYAIHWKCAQMLVDEVLDKGITEAIDNRWFMQTRRNFTKVPMAITDPICGMGALRKSTIWRYSATHNNLQGMLQSFKQNFIGDLREDQQTETKNLENDK